MASLGRVAFACLVGVLAACAEPDPHFGDPNAIVSKPLPKEDRSATAGGDNGPFGAAYNANANAPTKTLHDEHAKAAGRAPASDDAVGDCMVCHVAGGAAATKAFDFGGRITSKAANIDVIVVNTDGTKLGPVKSDKNGFFWSLGSASIKASAHVTIRGGKATQTMTGALGAGVAGGGCLGGTNCHGDGKNPMGDGI